jgi:hypothetical protein
MAQRKTLTEQQVAILRWIGDGCPDGVMEGTFHRISAGALRNRGLVKTSGRGPSWSAKITAAGREYLREVDGPEPPIPRKANVSITQQFVDDIAAAGGAQRFPQSERWDLERKARLATRHRKVPDGMRLEVARVGDEVEIRLVHDEDVTAELLPVAIPEKIGRYHPAARAFRDRREHHEVSREQLPRATRIVHAIAREAERRGWAAAAEPGCLQLTAQGEQFSIRLREDGVRPRGSWERDVEHYRGVDPNSYFYRDRTLPTGPYDAEAEGRLRLELLCKNGWIFQGRQSRWSDRQSWMLEERLPHLFREIEERIVEAKRVAEEQRIAAEKRAEAERREAEERERRWHVLMEQARQRLVETHRASHLRAQAEAWEQAERLRRYCDALAEAYSDNPRTAEWIAWAREYAARLDPLAAPPAMPGPPEETREALQQHLPNGWSVYGPEHGHRPRHFSSFR